MSTPPPLPREIINALSRWQILRKGRWNLNDASACQVALTAAVQSALKSGREALSRSLHDFVLYLGFLIDGDMAALNASQVQRLGKLEEAVLNLLRAERTGTASTDTRKRILMLAPDSPLWRTLAERLETPQLKTERFADPIQLLARLDPAAVAAVLIDQDFLLDLGSVADRLEGARSAEALGATVIYVNRSRDLNNRILALSGGADTSLEGDDPDHLLARIGELVDVRNQQDNLRVLVVEDDRSQAMYCEAILRKQGIDVRIAGDSRQALEDIRAFVPDLVLMDLHMPEVDGMQLTALIREDAEFALLPIVFLTGEQDEASRFNALRAGGDDYLIKPVRPRHLVTAVVTRARRARSLKRQFSHKPAVVATQIMHAGEFVGLLRTLGVDRPCNQTLLLCAADSGRLRRANAHLVVERENQFKIIKQMRDCLAAEERLAPWHGGAVVMMVERLPDEELMVRAESIRQKFSNALQALGVGDGSLAVVPLPAEAVPSAETLFDLCERTLAIARHAGGGRVGRALAEAQSDLSADLSLAIQKSLALKPTPESTSCLYQPIVPLHGAARPQYHLHLGLKVDLDGERIVTRRDWLPLARRTGHAIDLDRYAVLAVLERIAEARHRQHGLRIVVAVNGESLIDGGFRNALQSALAQHGLTDPGLVLSIDHSEAMMYQAKLRDAREELRASRVLLSFGRVGSEMKGTDVIDVLRPELIAVDAVMMRSASQSPPILDFARDRGIEVVAHFIPDAQTLARLFALGIDYGLGSFIGAPALRLDYDFGEHQMG